MALPPVEEADPFDLPEWIGVSPVTWSALSGVGDEPLVRGELSGASDVLPCDLLAADRAYPLPVLDERWRRAVHQSWAHGQVLLLEYDGRLTLAVPRTAFTADDVLEALRRLAKAVGVKPDRFSAVLRL